MRPPTRLATALLLSALPLGLAAATAPGQDGAKTKEKDEAGTMLDRYRDKNRPLLIFAPDAKDLRHAEQTKRLKDQSGGMKERQMVLVEVLAQGESRADGKALSQAEAAALRAKFDVPPDQFFVILLGKDGGEKTRWFEPVAHDAIFKEIDAMPMRKAELDKGKDAPKADEPKGKGDGPADRP